MTTSAAVRQKLVEALSLDLVGPDATADDHYQDEIISQAPSKWYLTGFLVPYEASVQDRSGDTADEGLEIDAPTSKSSEDENTPETASARKALFPSSIGLSFLISDKTTSLDLEVYWGDYQPIWIAQQSTIELADPVGKASPFGDRSETAKDLLHRATIVNQRIAAGLQVLDDPDVLTAFRMANRLIATAIRQRGIHNSDRSPAEAKPPTWRPFQLAFLLMNLVGIDRPTSNDREIVDLLFQFETLAARQILKQLSIE